MKPTRLPIILDCHIVYSRIKKEKIKKERGKGDGDVRVDEGKEKNGKN